MAKSAYVVQFMRDDEVVTCGIYSETNPTLLPWMTGKHKYGTRVLFSVEGRDYDEASRKATRLYGHLLKD
jgi:hypothetical protein